MFLAQHDFFWRDSLMQEATELWVLCGRSPALFQLPYYVTWQKKNEATIEPAFPLRGFEIEAAARILALHGRVSGSQWVISRSMLECVADHVNGNPEEFYCWGRPRPKEQRAVDGREERSEFIDSLFQAGIGESPEQLTFFWREFCQHAAHWLINKEKPVDMIFLRLHNCPYRPNWKTLLTQRFPKLGSELLRKSAVDREQVLDGSGFNHALLNLDLLAFQRKNETCYRQVEVEHRKAWWKLVYKAESQRVKAGPYEYARYFVDAIRRFAPTAKKLYSLWLAQISKPCVRDFEGGLRSRIRFMPDHMARELPATVDQRPVVSLRVAKTVRAREPETVSPADGQLPALPAVQPAAENMWDGIDPRTVIAVEQPNHRD